MKKFTRALLIVALAAAPVALAGPSKSDYLIKKGGAGPARAQSFKTEARLSGDTLASGRARYQERIRGAGMEQRFDIQVEDAAPGEEFVVLINGQMFGVLFASDLGVAELQFRTAAFIDDPGDGDPIPSGFPRIDAGAVITVGPIGGVFVQR
jgi:hypothetical protein